ncbi:MAG: hypothetical protein ACP5G2_06285 [Candidatus Bipolaricaulaceae bacterium]
MRNVLLVGTLALLLGCGAAAATLGGSWTFNSRWNLDPFGVDNIDSVLRLDYTMTSWNISSVAVLSPTGLNNLYFDVDGAWGPLVLRSVLDFNAVPPAFRTWLVSGATAIAGVNLFALSMLDDVGTPQAPQMGYGLTVGGWQESEALSVWAAARFNMEETIGYVYGYGYDWLLDHFIFRRCNTWFKPSGYVDVQTGSCALEWTGAEVYIETPLTCFDLLIQLSLTKANGFEQLLIELTDLGLELGCVNVEWIDVLFTTTSKTVNMVFDVDVGEAACITPFFALQDPEDQGNNYLGGVALKAILAECSWDGATLKAGHLFDEDGWYPYLNYHGSRIYGFTWDGELATTEVCAIEQDYDEFFGLQIEGPGCCGGTYGFSAFAWFDTGDSSGLFDWAETRASLRAPIGSNADFSFSLSVTTAGVNWIGLGSTVRW